MIRELFCTLEIKPCPCWICPPVTIIISEFSFVPFRIILYRGRRACTGEREIRPQAYQWMYGTANATPRAPSPWNVNTHTRSSDAHLHHGLLISLSTSSDADHRGLSECASSAVLLVIFAENMFKDYTHVILFCICSLLFNLKCSTTEGTDIVIR